MAKRLKVNEMILAEKACRMAGSIMVALPYGEIGDDITGYQPFLKSREEEITAIRQSLYRGVNQAESDALRTRVEFLSVTMPAGVSAEKRFRRKDRDDFTEIQPVLDLLQKFTIGQELWIHLGLLNLRAAYLVDQNWHLVESIAEKLTKS